MKKSGVLPMHIGLVTVDHIGHADAQGLAEIGGLRRVGIRRMIKFAGH